MGRNDVARQKCHPFKEISNIGINVAGHFIAVGFEISDRAPNQTTDWISALGICCPIQVPDDIFTCDGLPVLPGCAITNFHMDTSLVGIPAPLRQHAGLE